MKKTGIITALVVALASAPFARAAEPLADTQIELIRQSCGLAQVQLKRVLEADNVTRLNRGRDYEAMISLLTTLNSRVALNALSVPALTDATTAYQQEFAAFKAAYVEYGDLSKKTKALNCREQPVTFYDMLIATRTARAKVSERIVNADQLLGVYDRGLSELATQVRSRAATEAGGEN